MNLRVSMAAIFLVGAAFSGVSVSHAEEAAGVDEEIAEEATGDIAEAQEAFDRGARYYYEEEYSSAIVEFRRANQIHPHPIFQHNIALSNQHLGRTQRALEAALAAEESDEELPPETAAVNRGLIASLVTVERAEVVADDVVAHRPLEDEQRLEEPVSATPADEEGPSSWGRLGWAGVAGLGVGAAALGGAAVIDRGIVNDLDAIRDAGEGMSSSQRSDLESRQTRGRALLFSGAGLAAAGATLVVLEWRSEPSTDSRGLAVSPSLERPGMDISVRW